MNLIIDGITGAGKSIIIKKLKELLKETSLEIIYEEETFGDLLEDIEKKDINLLYRLDKVIQRIINDRNKFYILERFHLSYFPFINDWSLLENYDLKLKELNFEIIMLDYDDNLLFDRALNHNDVIKNELEGELIKYFGSHENAIKAYKESKDKRLSSLSLTKIPFFKIDTSKKDWDKYTKQILQKINL
ncbi:MAG: hypothetical protein U0354_06470 [Candidatus Sericytochromatia bacterium]